MGRKGRDPRLLLLSTVAPPLPEEPKDFSEDADSGTDVANTEPAGVKEAIIMAVATSKVYADIIPVPTYRFVWP